MGVRGLTSYIARNAELYLQPFELHDCDLVIDGDNLACNLYKDLSGCNSAFGGDYDEYYRTVVAFFHLLFECNIRPFVLLDGGYESKKMRTVEQRLLGELALVKHLHPNNSKPLFPLMMKEVFVDAVRDCDVKVMRCIFEAHDELVVLARKLDCPVLSYDSDFYILNVKYIPLVTVTLRVLTKSNSCDSNEKSLRHCEAKNIKKRKSLNKGIKLSEHETSNNKTSKKIKYLDCCLYKIENLTVGCKLRKDMLPIFAALLGNDYIEAKVFNQFFSNVCMKGMNKKITRQQRRIVTTLHWLKHETKESALEKILGRMKKEQRERLLMQIESATNGYSREKSISFDYFGLQDEHKEIENTEEIESISEESDVETDIEEEETISCTDTSSSISEEIESISEESDVETDIEEEETISCTDTSSSISDEEEKEEITELNVAVENMFPDWFCKLLYSASLPRFCIDLMHQHLFINSPQVQNFRHSYDCFQAALPILQLVHIILHYPSYRYLRYLSRKVGVTKVEHRRIYPIEFSSIFEPKMTGIQVIKNIFISLPSGLPRQLMGCFLTTFKSLWTEILFDVAEKLPSHMRLYFLAIVFWSKNCEGSDVLHFHAILICLVVLSTIDSKIVSIRNLQEFDKKLKKIIQKERQTRIAWSKQEHKISDKLPKEAIEFFEEIHSLKKDLRADEKINYISKMECLLVQENLLKYFQQPNFAEKYSVEFGSYIVHGFSEFQSVVYQLHTLNILVNNPFESVKMGQMYSGMFLYNLYAALRPHCNINYYVQNYILRDSPIMFEFYQYLIVLCKPFVHFLKNGIP